MAMRSWAGRRRGVWVVVGVLAGVVLVFFAVRLVTDVPGVVTGVLPRADSFQYRYVAHPVPAYVHIVPGMVFLLGALFQLSGRFRSRHLVGHRRLGRVLVTAGLLSGVLAVVVGVWFPFGGPTETGAAAVFGVWFLITLVLGRRAVRRRDVLAHRRWMIRAFAVALGVGTIRVWVGVFQLVGVLAIQDGRGAPWFGVSFWLALVLHVALAEAYLRVGPRPGPVRRRVAVGPAV
ncbi:DUF2306 domain-containing protein [Actinomycetospora endophytica]|uniref:DUF2306 domain-containing protein n=1 Tax=Actinomycetospora endophytica TaxID=2291215 RepID=A0ABS8P478_9PSEU|nr:DUF2306 domain-containing protein [Actinomycetospora endophytica]MCD2193062.1 DUF2306 domain-containing protein [Actinomycetospora endophytica]